MPHKILIVDDEPFMLRLIQHHLENAGYEMVKARNGREAIEAALREKPCVADRKTQIHERLDATWADAFAPIVGNRPHHTKSSARRGSTLRPPPRLLPPRRP